MSLETRAREEYMLAGRLVVYSDVAQCFYYPAKPIIALLKGGMESHLPFYELVGLDLKRHLEAIKEWMKSYEDAGGMCLDLQGEYIRLFTIAGAKVPAPPYGSFFPGKDRLLRDKATADALKLYADWSTHFNDIAERFAVGLEFMWYLIREEIKARGGALVEDTSEVDLEKAEKIAELQRTFLKEQIGVWYEKFLEVVRSSARTVFYCEVFALAGEFISGEMKPVTGGATNNLNIG